MCINSWHKTNTLIPYVTAAQGLCDITVPIHSTCWGCCKMLPMIRQVGSVEPSMEYYSIYKYTAIRHDLS